MIRSGIGGFLPHGDDLLDFGKCLHMERPCPADYYRDDDYIPLPRPVLADCVSKGAVRFKDYGSDFVQVKVRSVFHLDDLEYCLASVARVAGECACGGIQVASYCAY